MSTRNYELTYIVRPEVDATNLAVLAEKVKEIISAEGGSIVKSDNWGTRKLGYPIRKSREGQYVHLIVALPPQSLKRIEQRLRLNEDVLRHLLVVQEIHVAPAKPAPEAVPAEAAPAA